MDLLLKCYYSSSSSSTSTHTRKKTHNKYLYGVGRNTPSEITWKHSLHWSVLWEFWETISLDDFPEGITNNLKSETKVTFTPTTVINSQGSPNIKVKSTGDTV